MHRKLKKSFSILLTLVMLVGMLPAAAFAEPATDCSGECSHEAAIDTTHYDTLSEAIAAGEGKTITLLNNIDITENLEITKNLTLDLGGYSLNGKANEDNTQCIALTPYTGDCGGFQSFRRPR